MAGSNIVVIPSDDRAIDARSIVTLIIFFIANALVIFPLSIPLPFFLSRGISKVFGLDSGRAQTVSPYKVDSNREKSHSRAVGKDSDERTITALHHSEAQTGEINIGAQVPTVLADQPKSQSKSMSRSESTAEGDSQTIQAKEIQGEKRWHFVLGLETAPVIAVLLLLASTCIDGEVLRDGIVGRGGVRPYDIMTLFISFAYIALSLDRTNLLRYLAFQVATKSASSGRKLYISFFSFFSLLGLIVGNDPLILSGTPFLAHFSRLASIPDSTAYLFTQFQTANLVSALLVSSNPTNLVLTSAFGISFLSYSAWLALPTIASLIVLFPVLRWWVFRKEGMIPKKLTPPENDPENALHDPWGAIFGGCLFLITIVVLIALSAVGKLEGVEGVWTVTAPAAILILMRDMVHDLMKRKDGRKEGVKATNEKAKYEDGTLGDKKDDKAIKDKGNIIGTDVIEPNERSSDGGTGSRTPSPKPITFSNTKPPQPSSQDPKSSQSARGNAVKCLFPTVYDIITHLPLTLIPFAFAMFMLVESLQYTGWIRVWGGWWTAWARVGGVAGCVGIMGIISVIGCNIFGTNIGATVLLSRVLQQWVAQEQGNVSSRQLYGAVFALAVGSNFGAYSFVFPASLAGLLWRHLLKQKDMVVTRKEFARWNFTSLIVTMIVGCLVVAAEVCIMYDS